MSLFQRIRTPFGDPGGDDFAEPQRRAHSIGEMLRHQREALGLDLEAAGEALRIKPIYLAAIEQGYTSDLPGPAYAAGFIRAYAHYLGFDGDRVLDAYKAESADVQARPDLSLPVPLGARSVPGGPILIIGLILALCGYGTWYYLSTADRSRPERVMPVPADLQQPTVPQPNAGGPLAAPALASGVMPSQPPADASSTPAPDPGMAKQLAAAPPSAPMDRPAPAEGVAPPPQADSGSAGPPATNSSGQVEIKAVTDCWIQVRAADHSIVFSRVLKAGETYRVPRPGLSLRTGNAGALTFAVDGKPAPPIGAIGELKRDVSLDGDALLAGTAVHG